MSQRLRQELPVFEVPVRTATAIYTPGRLARPSASGLGQVDIPRAILEAAADTMEHWAALAQTPFRPVCLTLNLTDLCQLNCVYCFSRTPGRNRSQAPLNLAAIRAAARLVVECCAAVNKPFQIVFSGGGEPTMAWNDLQTVVAETRDLAASGGVEWRSYIATNGGASTARLRWLARNIGKIGLSCDGPPGIHDLQRPMANAHSSLRAVERAAQILREEGGVFSVRATITPLSVSKQSEIVHWLYERLSAREIRFEPVYCATSGMGFKPEHAGRFVAGFLAAQKIARELGVDLSLSGVRLDELHGPHCNVSKDVLHLRPDGTATACFLSCADSSGAAGFHTIGRLDEETGRYRLDLPGIARLRRMAARIPTRCADCLNAYHCVRDCPDVCLLAASTEVQDPTPGFRCRVARRLATAWLLEADGRSRNHAVDTSSRAIEEFWTRVTSAVRVDQILADWNSLDPSERTSRSLPAPLWARRGFSMEGEEAWHRVSVHACRARTAAPLSVYVHVPFCRTRCGFCDCYSEAAPGGTSRRVEAFAAALLAEIGAWHRCRPLGSGGITTVHFGGGTPNSLPAGVFRSIIARIRESLGVGPTTEWALESTSSLLTGSHLELLRELGFTRLHIGVQTLEEDVRSAIGRRESGEEAIARLKLALEMGFVVSADLIYGLPGQTARGWLETLEKLVAAGIDGVSLYSLQSTERNRRFLAGLGKPSPGTEIRFALFHAAHQFLSIQGYRKNHFAHFARERDQNLYYRHAVRGENLLALGPSADGALGPYLYRHPGLSAYAAGAADGNPVLAGALRMTPGEHRLRGLEAELLGNSLSWTAFEKLGLGSLLSEWQAMGLVFPTAEAPGPELSVTGSWGIAGMLQVLNRPRRFQ